MDFSGTDKNGILIGWHTKHFYHNEMPTEIQSPYKLHQWLYKVKTRNELLVPNFIPAPQIVN